MHKKKLILACFALSAWDWTLFLVILHRLSVSGHTAVPNWVCGYISVCVFVCERSGRRCTEWKENADENENHEEEEVLHLHCSWSPLFTDRGKQALLAICMAWPYFTDRRVSEALSVPPVADTLCLKPEPQLCSYPEEPRHVPPDLKKCLLIWTQWVWWRPCCIFLPKELFLIEVESIP